jgi:hypothetical protein
MLAKFCKLDGNLLGVKMLENGTDLPKRNLIICIDNCNMDKSTFTTYISYIPQIIRDIATSIDYEEMYIVRNYPSVANIKFNKGSIYQEFNSLKRGNSGTFKADHTVRKCCEGISIISQHGNNPFDVILVAQNKIYNEDWMDAIRELVDNVPNVPNVLYIYNTQNHIHLDKMYQDLKVSCFQTQKDYIHPSTISNIESTILRSSDSNVGGTFYVKSDYLLLNNRVNKPNKAGICSFRIRVQPSKAQYLILCTKSTKVIPLYLEYKVNGKMANIPLIEGGNDFDISDQLCFYKILLSSSLSIEINHLLSECSDVLQFILNLKPILMDIYQNSKVDREIRYIAAHLNREYRLIFKDYIYHISDSIPYVSSLTNHQNESKFMKLIGNFSKKAKLNMADTRLIEKVGSTILKKIYKDANTPQHNEFAILQLDADHKLERSREFFNSVITLTDWYDELKQGNTMGIMVGLEANDLAKVGANSAKPHIKDITLTFLPIWDYIEAALACFENHHTNDINAVDVITGDVVGTGNAAIPLYICSEHWKVARTQVEYVLGIILVNNPYAFVDCHLNFLFYVLSEMTRKAFTVEISDKWLQTYFALYRTCSQIAYEKGYHKGIKKLIRNYVSERERILTTRPFDNDVLFGQILSTGCMIGTDTLSKFCDRVFEGVYWRSIIREYKYDYLSSVLFNMLESEVEDELDNIIQYEDSIINSEIELIAYNYKMIILMRELFMKLGGFKTFLRSLDGDYGVASDSMLSIRDLIKVPIEQVNSIYLYKTINMEEKYNVRMAEYIIRSIAYRSTKQRRKSIRENPEIWSITSETVHDVVSKYKNLLM